MSSEPLVAFIDAETTGLDPDAGHEAWEWGLILRDPYAAPHERDVEYLWQVRPDLTRADPLALSKSGYYRRAKLNSYAPGAAQLVEGPDSAKVTTVVGLAHMLAPLLADAVVVGCNPGFDRDFLRPFLRLHGQVYTCHYRPVCVTTMGAGYLLGQGQTHPAALSVPWSSDHIASLLGVDPADYDRHTALGDCRFARDQWDAITGGGNG